MRVASGSAGPGDTLAALRSGRIEGGDERLRAAASLLEGSFYEELFKAMRATVPSESGSNAREIFEGLLDQSVAESAAEHSDRGIGAALYRELGGTGGPEPVPDPSLGGA